MGFMGLDSHANNKGPKSLLAWVGMRSPEWRACAGRTPIPLGTGVGQRLRCEGASLTTDESNSRRTGAHEEPSEI